ncbi:5'/3'-nucleotidase SurE [Aurantiacibacter gangjinensis]|uniref:5'-nucleotidase SurE n=1 Tax=Aurantiacibacter gangjinensis TaxID=502682 RepID=A0A0G9MJW6_9SPHN|nr:5'/3'-nucleotidase SurE [Aurantiacibacter gangjinensis]APE29405.1 5-nucleotidase SurE [Aurantiacibacter gangjinensis]KLE31031.1 stationary phase survival protein SurE [Aurantiacibacter gangjinensis]
MRILLSNDDGINAPGLAVLEAIARQLSDDVWVCAPAEENSGAGHSLTLHLPVRLREHGEKRFSVTGTPTDSVNLALRKLFADRKPDLVLSGVNAGENLGDDVTYSGTVSAAMEAALAGIPAIALSQAFRENGSSFSAAQEWGLRVVKPLVDVTMAKRRVINVNFPALPAENVRGIRVARQGFHDYARGSLVEAEDPRGRPYYWFGLQDAEHTLDHGTDLEAIEDGYVAVTPLQLDLTDHGAIGVLAERFAD